MEEPTEVTHSDGDIVWVKLGPCWWPGQVCGFDKLPPGLLKSFRKTPIAVVKFFQEESLFVPFLLLYAYSLESCLIVRFVVSVNTLRMTILFLNITAHVNMSLSEKDWVC